MQNNLINSYSDLDMLVFLQNMATTEITSFPFQGKDRRDDNLRGAFKNHPASGSLPIWDSHKDSERWSRSLAADKSKQDEEHKVPRLYLEYVPGRAIQEIYIKCNKKRRKDVICQAFMLTK